MSALVKLETTTYAQRLIRSMRDPDLWKIKSGNGEWTESFKLVYSFGSGSDKRTVVYAPQSIKYEDSGHMFRFLLADAPALKLSLREGVVAYLIFRSRVREFKRQRAFDLQQKTINFLRESGV